MRKTKIQPGDVFGRLTVLGRDEDPEISLCVTFDVRNVIVTESTNHTRYPNTRIVSDTWEIRKPASVPSFDIFKIFLTQNLTTSDLRAILDSGAKCSIPTQR